MDLSTTSYYLLSFQVGLMSPNSIAILLCSLRKRVCIAVKPGCSLHRKSPAAKQCKFLVLILHSSWAVLGSKAGSKGLRICKSVYFNFPRLPNRSAACSSSVLP